METPLSPDDLAGRVLGGRYRIERALRRGGMGQVYVARDDVAGAAVAVKVVRQSLIEDPQALARFKREARLVTELAHDNIVCSLASGDDGGLLWIAMELLEGESLRERLDARGRMSWQETLPIVGQIARALQAAHDKGVIHRDLKPENVMLAGAAGEERAKLLDFGVAKQAHVEGQSGTSNMTGTGLIVGTPGYVAPEVVLEGKTDDPRSDFYALGVTWFEMLTAQKPFTAKTAFALAMRHAHEQVPTPTSFVPYSPVPAPIENLVLRLMAKSPDERPQDAAALLDALANLAEESQRALANPTPPPASLGPHQATMTATDLRAPGTGVVPFKTPSPSATPATALQPGATPAPADVRELLPQLVAAIPKRKAAVLVLSALAAVAVVAAGVVLVVLHFAGADVTAGRKARHPVDVTEALPAPSTTTLIPAAPAPPPAPRSTSTPPSPPAPPTTPTSKPAAAAPDAAPVLEVTRQSGKRARRAEKAEKVVQRVEARVERAEGFGEGRIQGRPIDDWKIGIDGDNPTDAPRSFDHLPAGAHDVRFVSKHRNVDVTRKLDIRAGKNGTLRGPD